MPTSVRIEQNSQWLKALAMSPGVQQAMVELAQRALPEVQAHVPKKSGMYATDLHVEPCEVDLLITELGAVKRLGARIVTGTGYAPSLEWGRQTSKSAHTGATHALREAMKAYGEVE